MAASNRRLEKMLAHMQPNTDHLTFQQTAASELSDNDVVIVRYVLVDPSPVLSGHLHSLQASNVAKVLLL